MELKFPTTGQCLSLLVCLFLLASSHWAFGQYECTYIWVESSHWAHGKHFLLWLHDHTVTFSARGIMRIFSWFLKARARKAEGHNPTTQMVPLCINSHQSLSHKLTQSLSWITNKNMLGISLIPLICFIKKKKFQQQTLIDILVGFNTVNIQEQPNYHHQQEVSPSRIPDKCFTDCVVDSNLYFAND